MVKLKKKVLPLISMLIAVLFCSCGSNYNKRSNLSDNDKIDSIYSVQKNSIEDSIHTTAESEPRIIFLVYRVYAKNDRNQNKVVLLEKNIVKGLLKGKGRQAQYNITGNLECIELDERKKPIRHHFLENPIEKNVEFVKQDGTLQSKRVSLDSAETFIRFQLNANTKFIALSKIGANNSAKRYLIENPID